MIYMHLRKNLNFFEEDVLFDFGDDIEISHIETNNGKYTEKEKDILADMELDK